MKERKPTGLGFLRTVEKGAKRGWTLEKAKTFAEILDRAGVFSGAVITRIKKETDMSRVAIQNLFRELNEAQERGYETLESYWGDGRPCRAGKKAVN